MLTEIKFKLCNLKINPFDMKNEKYCKFFFVFRLRRVPSKSEHGKLIAIFEEPYNSTLLIFSHFFCRTCISSPCILIAL